MICKVFLRKWKTKMKGERVKRVWWCRCRSAWSVGQGTQLKSKKIVRWLKHINLVRTMTYLRSQSKIENTPPCHQSLYARLLIFNYSYYFLFILNCIIVKF